MQERAFRIDPLLITLHFGPDCLTSVVRASALAARQRLSYRPFLEVDCWARARPVLGA